MFDYHCDGDCEIVKEFSLLINSMIKDIMHLEAETIRTRFELSKHLPEPQGTLLRSDIFSNLGNRYEANEAYEEYVRLIHNGIDPMQSDEWIEYITCVANGNEY